MGDIKIKEKIKPFLFRFIKNRDLKDNDDIFALGYVNSLFAMQLVLFIEKEFKIRIENQDLDFQNFSSLDRITGLIAGKVNRV
ncbi:MAG: D-alanyl carrier protein [Candidatus Cloacimonetes bacterium 4572_55]|nr:MAG: D-alanyl carrier protein [Candidatus Cloacimonetes bacterium 4572_55]